MKRVFSKSTVTLAVAVLGGAALAVIRLLARSLLCLSRGARAAGLGAADLGKDENGQLIKTTTDIDYTIL